MVTADFGFSKAVDELSASAPHSNPHRNMEFPAVSKAGNPGGLQRSRQRCQGRRTHMFGCRARQRRTGCSERQLHQTNQTERAAWGFRDFPHLPVTKENRNASHWTLARTTT